LPQPSEKSVHVRVRAGEIHVETGSARDELLAHRNEAVIRMRSGSGDTVFFPKPLDQAMNGYRILTHIVFRKPYRLTEVVSVRNAEQTDGRPSAASVSLRRPSAIRRLTEAGE
jgi:hypothetical protein